MGLLDLLRFNAAKPPPPDKPEEHIFAVPLAAVKRAEAAVNPRETYIFYAFLFAKSAPLAVERLRNELRDEGLEFVQLKGTVIDIPLSEWKHFVSHRFEWHTELLPTTQQITEGARSVVYYTPKIIKYG
jgi:hypothetical protein